MRRGVCGTRDHAISQALVDHHGGEVGHVLHGLARLLQGHALLLAQLRKVRSKLFC